MSLPAPRQYHDRLARRPRPAPRTPARPAPAKPRPSRADAQAQGGQDDQDQAGKHETTRQDHKPTTESRPRPGRDEEQAGNRGPARRGRTGQRARPELQIRKDPYVPRSPKMASNTRIWLYHGLFAEARVSRSSGFATVRRIGPLTVAKPPNPLPWRAIRPNRRQRLATLRRGLATHLGKFGQPSG